MCGGRAVEFQSSQSVLEIACVGESERLGHLHDQATLEEFQCLRIVFCVFELVAGSGDFAQNLDAWFCRVFDDGEEGQADPEGDTQG